MNIEHMLNKINLAPPLFWEEFVNLNNLRGMSWHFLAQSKQVEQSLSAR